MLFELALLIVATSAGHWGVLLLRRRAAPTFALMLCATAAAATLAYVAPRSDGPGVIDAIGAVAIGAGACLLVLGPMMRRAARWAVATDRLRLAALLIELGDLLQPGTSGADDKATLTALREVRSGEIDGAVTALRQARGRAPAELHRAFDERIALLYVVAMRWDDAVAHAEATLLSGPVPVLADAGSAPAAGRAAIALGDPTAASATAAAAPGAGPAAPPAPADVARALGMSPPVWVELTAAYGRLGQLDRAAAMADTFERAAGGATSMAWLVHRVRLVFLAAAGRVDAVRRLLAQRPPRDVRPASRLYWSALAAERAGDREGARVAYQAALGHARRVPRVAAAIRRSLDELDRSTAAQLSPEATRIANDLAGRELTLPRPRRPFAPRVTLALVAANAAVAIATSLLVGSPGDIGAVVRAGASVRSAVDAGEWWRIPTSVFVHVGWIHLIVNLVGLWSLGRMAETMLGHARTLAIYACAGMAGALASHAFGAAGVSAGASGAIFGLLGALLVELIVAGKRTPRPGRNALIGALAFVALVQLLMGLKYAAIDQWGHAVGLAVGAITGALLSPHGPAARARHGLAIALALVACIGFGTAGGFAATTSYHDTLARTGRTTRPVHGVELAVPGSWSLDDDYLDDPEHLLIVTAAREPAPARAAFEGLRGRARAQAKELGFEEIVAADDTIVRLPAGWSSAELIATVEDDLGATQRFRVVLFAHDAGGEAVVGTLYAPEVLARAADDDLAALITLAYPVGPKVDPPPPGR